jgi:hypothetical protein
MAKIMTPSKCIALGMILGRQWIPLFSKLMASLDYSAAVAGLLLIKIRYLSSEGMTSNPTIQTPR